jgi:DNA mismatch repair protein MSH6
MTSSPKTPKSQKSLLSYFTKKPSTSSPLSKAPVLNVEVIDDDDVKMKELDKENISESPLSFKSTPSTPKIEVPVFKTDVDDNPFDVKTNVEAKKRKMIILESSDEDEKETPSPKRTPCQKQSSTPKSTPKQTATPKQSRTVDASFKSSPIERIQSFARGSPSSSPKASSSPFQSMDEDAPIGSERYNWLVDIRDKNMNRPGSEDYDPRTLYIPTVQWNKFTPFERQFWEIKSEHFDTVVFFKKGKFYELYENDADIGTKEFDLKLTDRVNMKMVGIPEATFEYWAAKFIAKG